MDVKEFRADFVEAVNGVLEHIAQLAEDFKAYLMLRRTGVLAYRDLHFKPDYPKRLTFRDFRNKLNMMRGE